MYRLDEMNPLIEAFRTRKHTGVVRDPLRGRYYFVNGRRVTRTTFMKSPATLGGLRQRVDGL